MIRLQRDTSRPAIGIYAKRGWERKKGEKENAEEETARAKEFYLDNYKDNKKIVADTDFTFKVYKDPELIAELERVCHYKCAYCESPYKHVHPPEVEHYRPKSAINPFIQLQDSKNEDLLKPGYYWLAADWNNLLISCIECNRVRHQDTVEYADSGKLIQARRKQGKHARFPILVKQTNLDGSVSFSMQGHVRNPDDDIQREIPLLLNPFDENPARDPAYHLVFNDDGVISVGRNQNLNGPSRFGEYTIEVYGLSRKGLTDARARIAYELKSYLTELIEEVSFFSQHKPTSGSALEQLFVNRLGTIKRRLEMLFRSTEPYIGMKRQILGRALSEWEGLRTVKQFGIDLSYLLT